MAVGGACADGGPYVSAQPCPHGAILMIPAIPVMIVLALVGTLVATVRGAPGILLPMWAALFGLLGWNFWEFGLTASDDGWVWGWIVCGVVFWSMAAPAVYVLVTGGGRSFYPVAEAEGSTGWWPAYAVLAAVGAVLGVVTFQALS